MAETLEPPVGWNWNPDRTRWTRQWKVRDFDSAVAAVVRLAAVANRLDHHPDLHIESWNRLRAETYSHDVGRITRRDLRLAQAIDEAMASV